MPPEIIALFAELEVSQFLGDDIWQLSLILEMNSNPACASLASANQELLPPHLRSIWLTIADQEEIAERLRHMLLARSNAERPSLLSTLAKCLPEISFKRLIQSIDDFADCLDEEGASTAIFALYDLLCHDPEDRLILDNLDFVRKARILEFLLRWDNSRVSRRTSCYSEVVDRYRRALLKSGTKG